MKRPHALLAAAALGLTLFAAGVTPAAAATHAQPQPAAETLAVRATTTTPPDHVSQSAVDLRCSRPNGAWAIYGNQCSAAAYYSCDPGVQGTLPYYPSYVSNGCSHRLWLYRGPGKAGFSLCLNPGARTGALKRNYSYAWVSDNPAKC
jgi:hypothetical protein